MPKMPDNNFPFIVSHGPKLQNDPTIRTIIRKQAMKDVGHARRKRADCGISARVNPKRLPTPDDTDDQIQSTASSDSGRESPDSPPGSHFDFDEVVPRKTVMKRAVKQCATGSALDPLLTITLSSPYEQARAKFQVDVTELSMLTNFHVGKGCIPILGANVSNLKSLLSARQWCVDCQTRKRHC